MQIRLDDRCKGTLDIVADLQYWKDTFVQEDIRIQSEAQRRKEEEKSKLHLKNCNEFLFIPETTTIDIVYQEEGKQEEVTATFTLEEMNLYNLFRYLIVKKIQDIDGLLIHLYGDKYNKLKSCLPDEQKVEMLQVAEELSNIDEMFRKSKTEDDQQEQDKMKDSSKKEVTTMADCIKVFGGTITYLAETWGKLPYDILKGMTYRQFKWYLDIIVEKQEELDKKYNKNKEDNKPWWLRNPNNPKVGNDGGKVDRTKVKNQKEIDNQNLDESMNKTSKIYDNKSFTFEIEQDESKRASNVYNPLLNKERGFLEQQGYQVIEDYEGAVSYRKVEKISDWRANDLFGSL